MIRTSPKPYRRAAATIVAAAVLSITTRHASAQQTVDLFGGTLGTPASLTVTSTVVSTGVNNTGGFGPGYAGSVALGAGAVDTLSEGFAPFGTSNSFTIAETGVATLGGSTTAATNLGVSLTPSSTYNLTLTRTTGFTVGLLGNVSILLNAGGTTFLNTATGQGLAGIVDVLGLFGSGNTATFQFTVPSNAAGTLGVNINSTEPVGALAGSFTFTSAMINQVPEPRTVATLLLGASGLALLHIRRRLRAV